MSETYQKNKNYKGEDYTVSPLETGEYENCIFTDCRFLNSDLSEISFQKCEFINCDLSMAILKESAFRSTKFIHCKLLGLRFDQCNSFSGLVQFENCILSFASFHKLKLKNSAFANCKMNEVDFSKTDLLNAVFNSCDLEGASFDDTTLENADLRTSFNFTIDPNINRIKLAKFSSQNIVGLLSKYNIIID